MIVDAKMKYKDIVLTNVTLRYWDNYSVEILSSKLEGKIKMFITFKCGICDKFVKRKDIQSASAKCPHCNNGLKNG
jgi:hypothetical protein